MKVTAITQFKHGLLYEAMKQVGWNQSELARQTGICASAIGIYVRMIKRPSINHAQKIHEAFLKAGVFLDVMEAWPETFRGRKGGYAIEQTADVEIEQLTSRHETRALDFDSFDRDIDLRELGEMIHNLPDRERRIIDLRFYEGKTLEQVAQKFGVTRERVRQIEIKTMHRLRNNFEEVNRCKMTLDGANI